MEIIYRAADGTEFEDEDECLLYESKKTIAHMNLQSRFFDFDGNQMDITDLYNCIENGWYMEIANMEEAKFIAEYAEREVSIVLFAASPCTGRFYWDADVEEWHDIEDIFNKYQKQLKIFEG